jgi:hypothetical protein
VIDHAEHYAAMCERLVPIVQVFARAGYSGDAAREAVRAAQDHAHAAFYDLPRLAAALRADRPSIPPHFLVVTP